MWPLIINNFSYTYKKQIDFIFPINLSKVSKPGEWAEIFYENVTINQLLITQK